MLEIAAAEEPITDPDWQNFPKSPKSVGKKKECGEGEKKEEEKKEGQGINPKKECSK